MPVQGKNRQQYNHNKLRSINLNTTTDCLNISPNNIYLEITIPTSN